MTDETEFEIGPIPEKYLNLRPHDTYEENIEALDDLLDGEYERVGETFGDMHPRVFHMAFSDAYHSNNPAKVDSEALEDMQEILDDKSGAEYFWPEEKLFNLGYRLGPKNRRRSLRDRRRTREKPYLPAGRDMIPDFDTPIPEPVRKGRKKREADEHYAEANRWLGLEIADYDIEVV